MSGETYTEDNNIVAPSDYHAALRAMEATFEEAITADDLQDPLAKQLFRSVQMSLLHNLSRIVQPAQDDQEYHRIIDPYHIVDDDDDDEQRNDEQNIETLEPEEFTEDEMEMEEIDETELLDTKAWEDARRLRNRVRELSQRVQQIRQRTLNHAKTLAEPATETSLRVQVESETKLNEELDDSIKRLSELVHNPRWSHLRQEMQKLQDTIDVVQKEQKRPLSQTEAAIISRSNSIDDEELYDRLSQFEDREEMPAMDRLAAFFEKFQ